jgi:SAM-dependent methyltransferase
MLRYFFYLAWNWDIRLALFIIRHEWKGEKKYGIHTTGIDDLTSSLPPEKRLHASIYQPVNYYTADKLFEQVVAEDVQGTLLDLGCGKGRIFGVGAAYHFKKIIGLEFSEKLCQTALLTARKIVDQNTTVSIKVVCQDAATYEIPGEVKAIFLFNPFDATVMREVIKYINESQRRLPRNIKILYANPVCKQLFLNEGFTETFYFKKMIYLEGSVLERKAFV